MNIEELKKKANNEQNWRERLEEVKALGETIRQGTVLQ
jgi:hypothetical protein